MDDRRIGVGIITMDRVEGLLGTLERLVALPEDPTIVVVDNGSTDGTAHQVRRRFPEVACSSPATTSVPPGLERRGARGAPLVPPPHRVRHPG